MVTIDDGLSLFATVCHYLHYSRLFALFGTIRYSGFPDIPFHVAISEGSQVAVGISSKATVNFTFLFVAVVILRERLVISAPS